MPIDYPLADYFGVPEPVFSQRVVDVIRAHDVTSVQILQLGIMNSQKGGPVTRHYLLHSVGTIACLNHDASDYSHNVLGGVLRNSSRQI